MKFVLKSSDNLEQFIQLGGGKAKNLARLTHADLSVPRWFCISSEAFQEFVHLNDFASRLTLTEDKSDFAAHVEKLFLDAQVIFPPQLKQSIEQALQTTDLRDRYVAVRSSGLDEDSAENSFAGQFSSYLFQKGTDAVIESLKRCWASGFSERAMAYRIERGLPVTDIRIGVVVQLMVNADCAGVAFSRNPMRPTDRDSLIISSVWGLGEGLVSGELDADNFEVNRTSLEIKPTLVEKSAAFRRGPDLGLVKVDVPTAQIKISSLTDAQVREIATQTLELEKLLENPQDCEWAYENETLYLLQTRPITSLPSDAFFDAKINGDSTVLWDNSNIIESYSGVTSPLTFSFASSGYRQVYIQFCEVIGVPQPIIKAHELMFRNMLGLLRGRIYYNLIHWYRLVLMLPGSANNKSFMETMMGVKQQLKPQFARVFDDLGTPIKYSLPRRISIGAMTLYRFVRINKIISEFRKHFDYHYEATKKLPLTTMSLGELSVVYRRLDEEVLRRWQAPIINDYLCMIFFGVLKKLTEKWVGDTNAGASLQNDLLCGQGALESTEPTKMLMRIAGIIDGAEDDSNGRRGDAEFRTWYLATSPTEIRAAWLRQELIGTSSREIWQRLQTFLDLYGFRCINELKLEEPDLHDDPTFVISAIAGYVKMKSYSIQAMEERERAIKEKAEVTVRAKLSRVRALVYFWIVGQTRKAVRNRENLRFARTKIFGLARHLFRGMGNAFTQLGTLSAPQDIFYLTVEEIFGFIEGRSVLLDLKALVALRKVEYEKYQRTPAPPDRLLTTGAVGVSCLHPQILFDADLLRDEMPASDDPNILMGTPCCPGIVEGTVRVMESIKDAEGFHGEILVTARTDPGWVPLFPSCTGLLVERGSLLSHSAVVARELGLPTIVGISGGLMKRLKTGQRVRIDAGKGEVRILS
jgi:phosphohistidine swiveling domain-containing protein